MPLICFTSPKGGVGKTTLAANIAGNLARSGYRVIALDVDPQNTLRLHFGVPLDDRTGFTSHLADRPEWRASLRSTESGVNLLAYGPSDLHGTMRLNGEITQTPALLGDPVRAMLADPRICLVVDTPPGPSAALAALLPHADLLVTVLLVDATSAALIPALNRDADAAGAGTHEGTRLFILNQLDTRTRLGGPIAAAASRHLGERLLGIVYRDEHVAEAVAAQKLLTEYAPSAKAAHDVAAVSRAIASRLAAQHQTPATPPVGRREGWFRR